MAALPKIHAFTLVQDHQSKLCDARLFMPEYRGVLPITDPLTCPKCIALTTKNN